jgi:arginase
LFTEPILTTVVGVPIDCTGKSTGVERMPSALRAAGLVNHLNIEDAGDLPVTIDTSERDPITGIIGFHKVCQISDTIRIELGKLLRRGERPLVVGGCCTLLIGIAAALRQEFEQIGLAFVDGHLDFYDGKSSPTGEAADIELAILTGHGPSGLIDLAGLPPLIAPSDIITMGFRDAQQAIADVAPDPARLVPEMKLFDIQALRRLGAAKVGNDAAKQFEEKSTRFWLHLDLDVLDQDVMPAVDYRMPGGLSWGEVAQLVRPLIRSPALVGLDITIFNPTLDTNGYYAGQIVKFLTDMLKSKVASP